MHVCVCIQRLWVITGCLPQSLTTDFWDRASHKTWSSRIQPDKWPVSSGDSPGPTSPGMWLQVHLTKSGFSAEVLEMKLSPHIYTAGSLRTSHLSALCAVIMFVWCHRTQDALATTSPPSPWSSKCPDALPCINPLTLFWSWALRPNSWVQL